MRADLPKAACPCPHNEAVFCKYKEKPCATCGWNPEVEKKRLDKISRTPSRSKNNRK